MFVARDREWSSASGQSKMVPPRLNLFRLLGKVIDEEVFARPVRAGVEGAASFDAGHIVGEAAQHRAVVEHEGVDGDPIPRDGSRERCQALII